MNQLLKGQGIKKHIALYGKPIAELRSVTCHIGSHSVTCHPTELNVPCLNPSQTASIYLSRRNGRLSWCWCWLYIEMVYLSADSHPSQ